MLMYLTIIDSKEGQQKFEFIYNRYKKLMFYIANKDGRNASLSKSVEAEKGTTYRAKAEVTVWINGKSETKTITTTGKTA